MIKRESLMLSLVVVFGCGGSPPPAPATPAAAGTPGPALTEAQVTIGHFRSPDGMIGLVLDRTGKPKLKVDGQNDIVELTQKEDRGDHNDKLRGYILEAPDGSHPIYITLGGGIQYKRGRDEFNMAFDKKADPLPAATVTGTFVKPKPAHAAIVDRLTAISVRVTSPTFKAEDAALPAKVGEAIDKATPAMAVHYESRGATSWLPHLEVAPDSIRSIGYGGVGYEADEKWEPGKGTGLAKFGGKMVGFFMPDNNFNHTNVTKMKGYPAPLADNTPGLVWEVDGTTAIFVAFDGGRYKIDLASSEKGPTLEMGAGNKAQWPGVQHSLLDIGSVSQLSKAGAFPEKATTDLEALDTKWNECTQKAWKDGPQKAMESHKGPGPRFSEAERKAALAKVKDGCKKNVDEEEKIFVQLIEERSKARQALLDKAKAKF